MRLNLSFDPNIVSVEALIKLEELTNLPDQQMSTRALVEALVGFVVDEEGRLMEPGPARQLLGQLTIRQLMEALQQLGASLQRLREAAIPPALSGS